MANWATYYNRFINLLAKRDVAPGVLGLGLCVPCWNAHVVEVLPLKTLKSALIPMILLTAGAVGAQTISVNTSSLTFSAQAGGSAVSQQFTVTATGGNTPVAVVPSQTWLTVTPSSGTTPQQFTVTANPTSPSLLSPGTYQDTNFRIINLNNTGNTVTIPVTFTVSSIAVTPQSLTFAYTMGSNLNPLSQNLTLTGQAVNYTVTATTTSGGNWIEPPSPSAGALPSNSQINVLPNLFVLENLSVGTYQGVVTITPSGASSGINIPVTLTVSPEPPVTVSPTSVNLNYQIGGLNNQGSQQAVTLATTSSAALPYTFGTPTVGNNPQGCQWISVTPSSGNVPANSNTQSTISYNCPGGLPAGTYSGSVPLAVTGGALSTSSIPVNLLVSNSPLLFLPTGALNFTYELGTNAPAAQTVTPQSSAVLVTATSGQMPITATASTSTGGNWLSVTPTAAFNTGTPISVSVNPGNLLPGTYMGTVTVSPAPGATAGNGAQTVAVTLTVANDASIQATVGPPQGLTFPYQIGEATPVGQTVGLSSSTGAQLTYNLTPVENTCSSVNWLAVSPTSGVTGLPNSGPAISAFTATVQNLSTLPVGTCTGTITVNATNPATGNPALGSPLSIPVTLYVSNNPLLVVTTESIPFTAAANGSGASLNISVNSTNPSTTIAYTVAETTSSGGNWLTVSSAGSTAAGQNTVSVSANPGLLSAGTYYGTVAITATTSGVADSPVTIPVTLQVTSGSLSLSSNALGFTYIPGGSAPVAQTVQVTGSGGAVNYTAVANSGSTGTNWLSVTPTSGTTPGTLSISVNGTGLSQGTYVGTVVVTAPNASGSPATIQVTLAVNAGTISASPSPSAGLTFTVGAGATASAAQTITVSSTPVALTFTASAATASGGNWLSVSPSSGTTTGTVQVSVNAGSLAVGTYSGTVTITAAGATGSPITYPVTLNVVSPITITATPAVLSFAAILNASAPAAQTVQVGVTAASGATGTSFPFTTTVSTATGGNWLSVTPTSGTEPGSLSVSVNPTGLAAGTYAGTISISSSSTNGATPATVNVTLSVSAAPTPVVAAVANAASGFIGSVSPGEEVALYGSNFGPSTVVGATPTGGAYPTTLSNTQVLFDGTPAPVIAVTNGQINVMVPYGVSGRATTAVQVSYLGVTSPAINYNVVTTVPGIYTLNQTGSGQGAILDQGLSVNGSNNPAAPGSVVAVYMTGEGITTPPSTTGQLAPSDGTGLNKPVQTVTATVGGVAAQVQYAGSAPGLVYGVMQVNVQIPANAPAGSLPIVITVGTTSTQNGVTVAVN